MEQEYGTEQKLLYIYFGVFLIKETCVCVYTHVYVFIGNLVHSCSLFQDGEHMKENELERKFVAEIKKNKGFALKFISPGYDGMPDRLVLLPNGVIAFVELKATGCKPRPLQLSRHGMLRSLGFKVFVLDDVGCIQKIIKEMGGTQNGT